MALKKLYKSGKKYNYVLINQINYIKDQMVNVNIILNERNSSWKPKKEKIEVGKDEKGKPVYEEFVNEQEPVKRITEMNFTIPLVNPETGKPDDSFSLEGISKKDNNLVKSCYKWLKENVDLFRDWEDC